MNGVVEIDAGQHRKHIGLQERDQQFERGQRNGEGDYTIKENTEEDNWRYVETSQAMRPLKPVLDGEPSYEDIPQGLHHLDEPRWKDYDIRRIY